MSITAIKRPPFRTIPLAEGLKLSGGGRYRFEEKMDGVWGVKQIDKFVLVGEQMKDGKFYAFDAHQVLDGSFIGKYIFHNATLEHRLEFLDHILSLYPEEKILRPAVGTGGEFLEAVLARGGEGIVIKDLDAPYGAEWIKCKRTETFDCFVTEKHASKASIHLMTLDGEDLGWCPCRAAYDSIKVGDIVEVAAYGRHSSGRLREPRFVRLRPDKALLS